MRALQTILVIFVGLVIFAFVYSKNSNKSMYSKNDLPIKLVTKELSIDGLGYATTPTVIDDTLNKKLVLIVEVKYRGPGLILRLGDIVDGDQFSSVSISIDDYGVVSVTRTSRLPDGRMISNRMIGYGIPKKSWYRIILRIASVDQRSDKWIMWVGEEETVMAVNSVGVPFKGTNLYIGSPSTQSWDGCIRRLSVNDVPKVDFNIYLTDAAKLKKKTITGTCTNL
jgi:hypothetical protein